MSSELLIHNLQNPALYPHPVEKFELIQTHLSWVILTGPYAYKIKKPLNLGFNDFTSLEKRKKYCELEFSLNKVLAPDLYLGVIPIMGSETNPSLSTETPDQSIIEYAVKSKQFDQKNLLSNLNKNNQLDSLILHSIAKQCADFHAKTPQCDPMLPYGNYETLFDPIQDNFDVLKKSNNLPDAIVNWAVDQYQSLKPLLIKRKDRGFIRACHGDLHLGNIVLIDNKPVIFDCIEFNESFRWIDTISDVAFLVMDLEESGKPELANYFINQYCEYTGDYEGLVLLPFYKSYKALIRAKVALLSQEPAKMTHLIQLALSYTQSPQPSLTITFGPSGSGKSHYTESLPNYIRLRSDVIRKQLMGLPGHEPAPENKKPELYSEATTKKLYNYLKDIAKRLLSHAISVVIDAACLKHWQRDLFCELANELKIPFSILVFESSPDILRERLAQRALETQQPSDATLAVLEMQLNTLEPLSEEEKSYIKLIS